MEDSPWEIMKDKYPTNPKGLKGDYAQRNVANTRHLKRILVWLEEVDYVCATDLREITIPPNVIKDALIFLESNKLVKSISIYNSHKVYCLNYKEPLVKEKLRLEENIYQLKVRHKRKNNGN